MHTFGLLALAARNRFVVHLVVICPKNVWVAVVAVTEDKVIVEDKIEIMKKIDDDGRVGDGDESGCPGAVIEMLAPSVERRREDAAALPVYRLLVGSRGPDRSFAFTAQYIDDFFEQIPLRLGATARWNVTNIGAIDAFRAEPMVSPRACAGSSPHSRKSRERFRN